MCCSNPILIDTGYSVICKECGLEQHIIRIGNYSKHCSPLRSGYNRQQRWNLKINKLIGYHSGPTLTDPIWGYLKKNKHMLQTTFDVRQCIRNSNLKHKHYDSMRVFTDCFTNHRVLIDSVKTKDILIEKFKFVNSRWNASGEKSFFSYCWLLRKFLTQMDSPLTIYLKPPTCQRRASKYKLLFEKITLPHCMDSVTGRDRPNSRLHNDLSGASTPPSVRRQRLYRVLKGLRGDGQY